MNDKEIISLRVFLKLIDDSNYLPGHFFLLRLWKWISSFDQQKKCFQDEACIDMQSQESSLHHYISCVYGKPLWAEGQWFVESLSACVQSPVIQFEKIEQENGEIRFYVVIITQEWWHERTVYKTYAFGVASDASRYYGGERSFKEPVIWNENLEYRQFLRFMQ